LDEARQIAANSVALRLRLRLKLKPFPNLRYSLQRVPVRWPQHSRSDIVLIVWAAAD